MGFKEMNTRIPRLWAVCGLPNSGKTLLAARMIPPILVIDSDHRFSEVLKYCAGPVYQLSDVPEDYHDPRRISDLLEEKMPGSGVRTIAIDSTTAIIQPLITRGMMENRAGENKNYASAFIDKALGMRLLQDAITKWGCDTFWVYHSIKGKDGQAKDTIRYTIPETERGRLLRSLNVVLKVEKGRDGKRAVTIEFARTGQQGATIIDQDGYWLGMPDRIEEEIYAS